MSHYCYHCGKKVNDEHVCPKCGANLNPPPDVYCDQRTCNDEACGAEVPRWSRFCPSCGKEIWQYDPKNIEYKAQRHKGLLIGALVWTIIVFVLAFVLTLIDEEIPLNITLVIAAVLSVIIWIVCFARFERGRYIDGTVVRHWTEKATESVLVPDEKDLLNRRYFLEEENTLYKTEIKWDNGKSHTTTMQNCAANHIQLAPGDRIRKFRSTGEFVKLSDSVKMQIKCEYCDSEIDSTCIACPHCGAKVETIIRAQERLPQQTYTQPQKGAPAKPRRSVAFKVFGFLIICGLVTAIAVKVITSLFPDTRIGSERVLETATTKVTASAPTVTLAGVTVEVNALNLTEGEETLTVSRQAESDFEDSGLKSIEYDISLGDMHRLKAPLTLTVPYDKAMADGGRVVLAHYDSDYGIWIPLGTTDNGDGTVTASLNSLSPIRAVFLGKDYSDSLFYISNMNTANAQMKVNMNWWEIVGKQPLDTAAAVANGFLMNGNTDSSTSWLNDAANEVNTINTYYTLFGGAGDAVASMLGEVSGASSAIGVTAANASKGIGAASLIIAGVQLAYDAANPDAPPNTAAVNLLKNICSNGGTLFGMATGGGTAALSIAFFGVAVFGYGLDTAVEYAKDIQEDTIKAICETYYSELDSFDEQAWYELFVDAYLDAWQEGKGSQNGLDQAMGKVKTAIDDYAEKFWKDIYKDGNDTLTFAVAESGRTNYFTPTAAQKKSIILGIKKDIYERFEYNVIPWINAYMKNEMRTALYCSLLDVCAPFNEKYSIQIQEVAPQESGEPCEFQKSIIRFAADGEFVTPDIKDVWRLESPANDDEWAVTSEFTLMAYVVAGMPDSVYIYNEGSNFASLKDFDEMRSVVLENPEETRLTLIDLSREDSYSDMPSLYNVKSISYAFADGEYPDDLIDIADSLGDLVEYAFIKAGPISVEKKGNSVAFKLPSYAQTYSYNSSPEYYYSLSGLTFNGTMNGDMTEGTFTVTGGNNSYTKNDNIGSTKSYNNVTGTAQLTRGDEEYWGLEITLSYTELLQFDFKSEYESNVETSKVNDESCWIFLELTRG